MGLKLVNAFETRKHIVLSSHDCVAQITHDVLQIAGNGKGKSMSPMIPGFGLIFLAAVAGGVFPLPLRVQRRYAWENTWLVVFLVALVIIPFTAVRIFLPVWPSAVAAAGTTTVLCAVAFGFLWGWGAVTFALGISSVGMSLGYATIMGLSIALGSIIPMIRRWDRIPADARLFILLGIATCLGGVAICGRAGVAARPPILGVGGAAAVRLPVMISPCAVRMPPAARWSSALPPVLTCPHQPHRSWWRRWPAEGYAPVPRPVS